ncbi:hypothetical protein NQ186_11625 [Pseudomonas zeae]|uniref:hypothetical protein n=1 Tax=Pseudomonas zeae TaxID=2745510 RepID=UPI0021490437|nr:hypothetical protein [Pseudomonas zeae]UUT14788.1 hypothetical protein NQ186_11625 [Pseudomonas zeae]
MNYSPMLYTKYEHSHNEHGEGGYTVFSTQQSKDINFTSLDILSMQTFAVLWWYSSDTRVVHLIEKAIIEGQLSPVKLLHSSKGTLVVVYDDALADENYEEFKAAWDDIASYALYDEWTAILIKESEIAFDLDGGWLFRTYAPEILAANTLGIEEFTSDMFLFWHEWDPEDIFGEHNPEDERAKLKQLRDGPGLFGDDVDF